MPNLYKSLALAGLLASLSLPLAAKVSPEEATKLGKDLSPIGAQKTANADGSIPAWAPEARRGNLEGEFSKNPAIDGEKPLFTIAKANVDKYAAKLTEGHKYLLKTYADYKLNIYPTHRVASYPDFIMQATVANATSCELIGLDNPNNCKVGFPFPIPKSGAEVMWNHRLSWRGAGARRSNDQMIVQPNGDSQLTKITEEVNFYYAVAEKDKPVPLTKDAGLFIKYFSKIEEPPRMAGTMILVHERAGAGDEGRQAWLYAPALKRIRRAPTVCCDNPAEGTDGHQFYDQVDMFNGILDRFTWKIVGKKEVYIPYNSNRIASPAAKYKDIATPKHLNQELARYELHRVWVVEADLRPGTNHTFKKRRFYLDEDSWRVVAVDNYDANDSFIQFQEGHAAYQYNLMSIATTPEVIYHFDSGRYFLTALGNENRPNNYSLRFDEGYFEATNVQKRATK